MRRRLIVVTAVLTLAVGAYSAYAASWRTVGRSWARGSADPNVSVGVEVRDPNRLRFTLDGNPDRFPSTDWYIDCRDANYNFWSRSGSANRKTPFTRDFDVPDDSVTCGFDVGAYHFRRGSLSLTLQKR